MNEAFHFIGIGGIGMSALASIMQERGYRVSGSDLKESRVTKGLEVRGIRIFYPQRKENVPADAIIVYSSDIKEDNEEMRRAKELGSVLLHRSELLRLLLDEKKALMVAGAHGKTTTTSLLAFTLGEGGMDPSYAIGGFSPSLKSNGYEGIGEYFVVEGDESDASFLRASPYGAILTNVDFDHLDYWKTKEALLRGYQEFIANIQNRDLFFYPKDDHFLSEWNPMGISYGFMEGADIRAYVKPPQEGKQVFDIEMDGKRFSDVTLNLWGLHNILNALSVFGMAYGLGVPEDKIYKSFREFRGVERRLEFKGKVKKARLYDDYAHHPKEIEATYLALKDRYPEEKMTIVFQPHRYTRLRDCMDEFVAVFKKIDRLVLTDVYAKGEKPILGSTIHDLIQKIGRKDVEYIAKDKLSEYLKEKGEEEDIIALFGAGDITHIAKEIVS